MSTTPCSATSTSASSSGCGQFVSTFAITIAYVRWANRNLDAQAADASAPRVRTGSAGEPSAPGRRADRGGRQPAGQHRHLRCSSSPSPWSWCSGPREQQDRRRLLRGRPLVHRPAERHRHRRRLPVRGVASSASPGPSRSTATTASCTRSASSSPGWWPCCWSPSCCATPASSRWPTCSASGCGSARSARRPRPRPCGLVLLPAGPDGRRRRPGRAAAQHRSHAPGSARHRRRRRADDRLRAGRRHEGHHLGADHQGDAAHRRAPAS